MADTDLFGNEIIKDELLRDKFIEPPFSVLDTKGKSWQNRKRNWLAKGIKSEIGRSDIELTEKERKALGVMFTHSDSIVRRGRGGNLYQRIRPRIDRINVSLVLS